MTDRNNPGTKQNEQRSKTTDERGVSHELKIEKDGAKYILRIEPDESGRDEAIVSAEESEDEDARAALVLLYERIDRDPTVDRLVIVPREDGGWDLLSRAEKEAREPASV